MIRISSCESHYQPLGKQLKQHQINLIVIYLIRKYEMPPVGSILYFKGKKWIEMKDKTSTGLFESNLRDSNRKEGTAVYCYQFMSNEN